MPRIPGAVLPGWESPAARAAPVAAAIALGLMIARLPLEWALAALGAAAVVTLVFAEPLIGLGLAVMFGPAKSLLAAAYHSSLFDPGQALFALALIAYVVRGAVRRELRLPLPPRAVPFALPLLAYIGVGLISLWEARSMTDGLAEVVKWGEVAIVVGMVARRPRWAPGMAAFALAAGVAQAVIGVWQFGLRGVGPEHFRVLGDHYRAYGTFEQPNPFGGFMGLAWPIGAGLALVGGTIPVYLATILCLTALYLSFSRGAWLGAAAAAGAMLMFWPRRRVWGAALMVAAVGGVVGLWRAGLLPAAVADRLADIGEVAQAYDVRGEDINDVNYAVLERLAHWQAALGMAAASPWLGVGIGNYEAAYPDYRLLNWPYPLGHAHNIYLNALAETGVLGLAAYLLLWGSVAATTVAALRRTAGWRRGLALGLLGAWAHLATHQIVDNLYVNNIHLYLGALLGALAALSTRREGALT